MQARRGLVTACSAIGRLSSPQYLGRSGVLARRWMSAKPQPSTVKASTSASKAGAESATAEASGKAAAKAEGAVGDGSVRLGGSSRGPVSWPSLVLLVSVGVGVLGYYQYERQRRKAAAGKKTVSTGKPLLGGPYSLVDHHGRPVSSKDLEGQFTLVYFGFTYCPDICPNELVKMGKVIELLDASSDLPKVQPVLISVDPHRDTVAQMRAYIEDFHPRLLGLTGTPGQVGRAAKAFRVFFQEVDREEDDDDYVVDHSIVMYLMDPRGKLVDFFPQLVEPQEMAERIGTHMRKELGLDQWDSAGILARVFGGGVATSKVERKRETAPAQDSQRA